MTIHSCDVGGKPGYQWSAPGGADGMCHVYDPEDIASRDVALRAAARDAVVAVSAEASA